MSTVLPLKRVVRGVIFNDTNHFLLGRQRSRQLWQLVGGKIEPGQSPLEAMVDELFHEAGLACSSLELVHTEFLLWFDHQEIIECFIGQAEDTHEMKPDGREIDALGWVAPDKIWGFNLTDTTELLLQRLSEQGHFL